MNKFVLIATLCLIVPYKAAFSHRETRAVTDCNGQSVANVCPQIVSGTMRLPHPTDTRQFLMCEQGGRMYVVRCPDGETYDGQDCTAPQVPQTTPAPKFDPYHPCTADKIAVSQLFFPYPGDNRRYIECRGVGSQSVKTCFLGQVYEPKRRAQGCVSPFGVTTRPTPVKIIATTAPANPCDLRFLKINNLYFPYPKDSTKFIQCDFAGNTYIMQCQKGLVWSQLSRSCVESVIDVHRGGNLLGGK